jgi:hypothetical protein
MQQQHNRVDTDTGLSDSTAPSVERQGLDQLQNFSQAHPDVMYKEQTPHPIQQHIQ